MSESNNSLSEISRALNRQISIAVLYDDHKATIESAHFSAEEMQGWLRDLADPLYPARCLHARALADHEMVCSVCGFENFGIDLGSKPDTSVEPSTDDTEGRADASA